MVHACRLGVGVLAFSWAIFNIGVWLCHAYLNRKPFSPMSAVPEGSVKALAWHPTSSM